MKKATLSSGLKLGGECRSRTGDLLHAMQALYPAELIPQVGCKYKAISKSTKRIIRCKIRSFRQEPQAPKWRGERAGLRAQREQPV